MRRRTLLVALVGLAAVVAAWTVVLWPRHIPPGAIWENVERVEDGMTLAQVEAIIGPPGDYRTGPSSLDLEWVSAGVIVWVGERQYAWAYDDYLLTTRCDASGPLGPMMYRVLGPPAEQDSLGEVVWRLKRQ
jgi:hypothetical protein